MTDSTPTLGISGRIAAAFQNSAITPLLALLGLLLGFFAVMITPKEEEPQIDVTFANVYIGYPGASAREVEQLVSIPAEQVLSEIKGVDDIFSISQPGQSILTVAFEVGIPRETAILNLYNQVMMHNDWFPANLGVMEPVIKPMGIDDVPIMAITLSSDNPELSATDLTEVAHALETELKKVPGTRDIYTIGERNAVVQVTLDPARMNGHGLAFDQVRNALLSANAGGYLLPVVQNDGHHGNVIQVQAGAFLENTADVGQLIVGKSGDGLVYLADVADIRLQADVPDHYVRTRSPEDGNSRPAVTIAIAKQPGENAIDITQTIESRLAQLKNRIIPTEVNADITRDYGVTAKAKSDKLISKLLFATSAVIVLVLATMGWREAIIVGSAIFITLAITLFASWVWGFTLNRVSLFALIFSIGILVDDAIVVVENIHRHIHMGGKKLLEAIPAAVDEVGSPTILATFTVIAALMPMAFVSGLMGPYMSPIPINASTGMLISLVVAFVVTPWLSYKLLKRSANSSHSHAPGNPQQPEDNEAASGKLQTLFHTLMSPFLGPGTAAKRVALFAAITALIGVAVALPAFQLVVLKMLPFDNKSEFQVIVDMPEGTPVEDTLQVLEALGEALMDVPEIRDVQLYAGSAAPINFNGLVRQYYMRRLPNQGDIQVNLIDKHHRERQSHAIARSVREPLQAIGKALGANVKIVEVPPGPPVMAPIVAEIYGPEYGRQIAAAKQIRTLFESTRDIVDVDDYIESDQTKWLIDIDRQKAAMLGVAQASIVQAISTALGGEDVSYLHNDHSKYPLPIRLELSEADKTGLNQLMVMQVQSLDGRLIALADLIRIHETTTDKTIYHKNLQPVVFVTADMAGELDSPLYGLFNMSFAMSDDSNNTETNINNSSDWEQWFIQQPAVTDDISMKWDGEWQITYETFRDMGIAYGVGMILIYLLVVAQFRSYLVPLIIMAPIPLTVIGVMPGHALFNAQFTATSMIGMIALAGIIVRNSILLVDFINHQLARGMVFEEAVISAAAVRSRPIVLTAVAAMIGAFFILDDPIFNGLAIALIFGIMVSTLLTLVVIPILYYSWMPKNLGERIRGEQLQG